MLGMFMAIWVLLVPSLLAVELGSKYVHVWICTHEEIQAHIYSQSYFYIYCLVCLLKTLSSCQSLILIQLHRIPLRFFPFCCGSSFFWQWETGYHHWYDVDWWTPPVVTSLTSPPHTCLPWMGALFACLGSDSA